MTIALSPGEPEATRSAACSSLNCQMPGLETTKSILKTVAYFDMFDYPLLAEEIRLFLDRSISDTEASQSLAELQRLQRLFYIGGFYSLRNDPVLATRRKAGNARAAQLLNTGHRIGRRLGKFPFVRGVGISGSLSKNYADEAADIDFFIITAANRLWIARTLLHALKKLSFITGKQHWYCMNYFIDEATLEMPEKNIFIAAETVTLQPVSGLKAIGRFRTVNEWAFHFFPNYHQADSPYFAHTPAITWYQRILETLFDHKLGNFLDNYLMRLTAKRWMKKERNNKRNMKGDVLSLRAGKHFARPDPDRFQKKILEQYATRLADLEQPAMQGSTALSK
jgi:hypothetical protein